jgi:hypothetical protein
MRCVNDENFFAPHPKLPLSLRLIRGYAILVGIGVGILCLAVLGSIYSEMLRLQQSRAYALKFDYAVILTAFLVSAAIQIFLLVPLWRCYLLRSWGCAAACSYALILGLVCFAANSILGSLTISLTAVATVFIFRQRNHLESGF